MLSTKTKVDNRWLGTPSWSTATNKLLSLVGEIGMKAVASLYPNDFDYYMCALELTTSDKGTIDYLAFPVNPDSISKVMPNRNNVKRSLGAVTVLSNPVFTPQEITISGSFGRGFKIITAKETDPLVSDMSVNSGKYSLYSINQKKSPLAFSLGVFNVSVKTGYGLIKILEAMVDKSVGLDKKGKPCKLYFYNMALGESYLVTVAPGGLQLSQDLGKNMIWNYTLTMQIVSPLEADTEFKLMSVLTDPGTIQSAVSLVGKGVDAFVRPYASMATTYGLTGF